MSPSLLALAVTVVLLLAPLAFAGPTRVDAAFPGGNVEVLSVEGDTLTVRPDQRGTTATWFYWYFRVRGAAGRTVTIQFKPQGEVVGGTLFTSAGPAVSLDEGASWGWLGPEAVTGRSFRYSVPKDAQAVRFAVAIPYVQANLEQFLAKHRGKSGLTPGVLCTTAGKRKAELLRVGCLDKEPKVRVLLTARHHACEMASNYVLEGLIEAVLADDATGGWLRANAELLIVPFVDKDGVEDGDQGKSRAPHDHEWDYFPEPSLYPTVAALKQKLPGWSAGKLRLYLDLHCPLLANWTNNELYFCGPPDKAIWPRVEEFARILGQVRRGPLVNNPKHNLPFGAHWNKGDEARTARAWMASRVTSGFAASLEIPYGVAGAIRVTPDTSRALGRDLAAALAVYLGKLDPEQA